MTIRRMSVCGAILSVVILSVAFAEDGKSTAERRESNAFSGQAAFVKMKGGNSPFALQEPQIRNLADRPFLVGQSFVGGGVKRTVWLPLSEVWTIEEFNDVKDMAKVYRFDDAELKKAGSP